MKRVADNSYIELSELLPEKIQEASLYPEGKNKKKAQPVEKFDDWVLHLLCISRPFCLRTQALRTSDLIIFMETVA